ncbi:hypothetical protein AMJ80_04825 [bacterium SM23_31]|nr:MAG: hypothetical protein AMJ80_04825 [bacterium SM23_31]
MKNIIYIFALIALFFNYTTVFSQSDVNKTPNGKNISGQSGDELSQGRINWINFVMENDYPNVEVIEAPIPEHGKFNCHFFAWHNMQGYGVWDEDYIWRHGKPNDLKKWRAFEAKYFFEDEEYSTPTGYASYVIAQIQKISATAEHGVEAEICVYKLNGLITHSARILEGSEYVISKWGEWGIYKHHRDSCPDGDWVGTDPENMEYYDYGEVSEYYGINPYYSPVNDPGLRYTSIPDALDAAGEDCIVSVFEVSEGSYEIDEDIFISSDNSIYFNPGAQIIFTGNYEIQANGYFEANGAEFKGNTGGYNDWDGIYIYDEGEIKDCIIKNAAYGMYAYNASSLIIEDNEFRKCNYGVLLYNGCYTDIIKNYLYDINNQGIYILCNPVNIWLDTVDNANSCINIYNSVSSPCIQENQILNALSTDGIYVNNTYADIEENYFEGCESSCVYNTICATADVTRNNTIIRDGDWSIYNANENHTVDATQNEWVNMLNYGLVQTEEQKISVFNSNALKKSSNNYEAEQLFEQGKNYYESNNCEQALYNFKLLIVEYSDTKYARKSYIYVNQILDSKKDSREENVTFFQEIKQELINNDGSRLIINDMDFHILYWLQRNKMYDETERKFDEMLEYLSEEHYQNELKFSKALFYIHGKKEPDKAVPYLQYLASNETEFSDIANHELIKLGKNNEKFLSEAENTIPENFKLMYNYPNPFNPVTTISFQIPEASKVTLVVYDILGREVTRLIDGNLHAGYHSATWNASTAASGIYIYRLQAGEFSNTKRMLLIK